MVGCVMKESVPLCISNQMFALKFAYIFCAYVCVCMCLCMHSVFFYYTSLPGSKKVSAQQENTAFLTSSNTH